MQCSAAPPMPCHAACAADHRPIALAQRNVRAGRGSSPLTSSPAWRPSQCNLIKLEEAGFPCSAFNYSICEVARGNQSQRKSPIMGWNAVGRFASELRMEDAVVAACERNLQVWELHVNGIGDAATEAS